ncbi:peptidylprolyl isomerase [bacterium]|jgi:peptidyl-prolyl cis-trans isomerase B (cyclophilin B)|nr:peptidylprolyl isomerase [bacterium]
MTSSNRRERELARAKYERQQARRSERENKARSRQRIVAIAVIGALVVAGGGWAIFSLVDRGDSAESTAAADLDQTAAELVDQIEAGQSLVDICGEPIPTRADDLTYAAAPDPAGASAERLTLTTNCGGIVIDLLASDAPATVASFDFLANEGFFDATACHRLTTSGIFVLQCGDPAGNGTGGPGYQIPDENLPGEGEANYPAGTVAMANAGPGTGGSQFFLVYEDTTLPSGYTIFGQITEGLDVIRAVAEAGVADGGADGLPAQPIVIESATVGAAQ